MLLTWCAPTFHYGRLFLDFGLKVLCSEFEIVNEIPVNDSCRGLRQYWFSLMVDICLLNIYVLDRFVLFEYRIYELNTLSSVN